MKQINQIIKNNNLTLKKITLIGKAYIVDTNKGKFVIKKNINLDILNYIKMRGFDYFPNIEDNLIEYINNIDYPKEQKILDLIKLVGLLHSKTTYDKKTDLADFKETYETLKNNILHLNSYYEDIITLIESHVFMSPSEYLLARNISIIFKSLNFCENELEKWYNLIKNSQKQRVVVLHNNLKLDHFLKNNKSYLISWDKSKIGIPIYDIYKLFKNEANIEYLNILENYEKVYPLMEEERILLFILLAIPNKIIFNQNNFNMTLLITKEINRLYNIERFISPYYFKQSN